LAAVPGSLGGLIWADLVENSRIDPPCEKEAEMKNEPVIQGRTTAVLAMVTGAGILLFWIGFFTIGLAPENPPECYLAFEHAFPLPDILLAVSLVAAGILVRKNNPLGRGLALACGGALMFLGLLDISFNIQNGIYGISIADAVFSGFINLWCVLFGLAMISRLIKSV